ncbi:MAG: acyltransferase [Myxococcales bacterium]|nr:acyltransferase [Myxococcales bacterium]
MLREHQPSYLRRARTHLHEAYARHFLHPHFDRVGHGTRVLNPWHVSVFGGPVSLGDHVCITATASKPVEVAVWSSGNRPGQIRIGDFTMINPGLRMNAACAIELGKNTLLAPNVYITDADWHGVYDRAYSLGGVSPVTLEDNVWVGESAIICKGVHIGRNSVVGAGAVVTHSVPDNAIVAGNPARVIETLDGGARFVSRSDSMSDPERFYDEAARAQRALLAGNSLFGYLRYLLFPRRGD